MATEYIVRIRNRAGIRQYDVTDFLALDYAKYLNGFGVMNCTLSGNHQAIDALERDGQVEVWRFDDNTGITPYCDFFGLYRARTRRTPRENKNGLFTLHCVEQKQLLNRAIVAFPAGVNNRSQFTTQPAETAMKTLVTYNATAAATTANDRLRTVGTWATYITVAADGGGGNTITKGIAHRKLLEALQEIALIGGLDFDLVKTGARAWEFRTYTLRGSDLSATVKFSLAWDNLDDPVLEGNDLFEETVAIVGGENEGTDRSFVVRTGPNYTADYNDSEVFVNAAQHGDASLNGEGDARLQELRARDDFRFNILQNGAFRYGRDYCVDGVLGDKVSVTYYEDSTIKRIRGAHVVVGVASGGQKSENIRLDLVTVN